MDLFSLVARLTLDPKDYEKELKKAEREGSRAKVDATGKIKLTDEYSAPLQKAQSAARSFQGDTKGTITADDRYSPAVEAAEKKGEAFQPNASDRIKAEDEYSGAIDEAAKAGREFAPGASDEISGENLYKQAIDEDIEAGQNFAPGAGDIISADDQYTPALDEAKDNAGKFDPNATGSITADDQYSTALGADVTAAGTAQLDAQGEISGTDAYTETLGTAEGEAAGARLNADGVISGVDQFSETLESAQAKADEAEIHAQGDIGATDEFSPALEADVSAAGSAQIDAHGDISATDEYSEVLSGAIDDANGADLDVPGAITGNADDYTNAVGEAQGTLDEANLDYEGQLTLNTEEYQNAIATAGNSGDNFGTNFGNVIEGLKDKLVAAGIVGAVVAIGQAFSQAVMESANYADTVDKGAQALSISRSEYQKWRYALGQSGADINTVTRGMNSLKKVMGGEISDDMAAALDALHINPADYNSTEELFNAVMEGLADIGEGSDRDLLVNTIFGDRNGAQLNALFNEGADGIRELKEEAVQLGLIMSDEKIAEGVKFGDAVSSMNQAIEALKNTVISELLPYLTDAANWITNIITFFGGAQDTTLADILADIDSKAVAAATSVQNAQKEASALLEELGKLGDYWTLDEQGQITWDTIVSRLLTLFPELSTYIDEDTKKINLNTEALKRNIETWSNAQLLKIYNEANKEKTEAVATQFSEAYKLQAEGLVLISQHSDEAKELVDKMNAARSYVLPATTAHPQGRTMNDLWKEYFGTDMPSEFTVDDIYDLTSFIALAMNKDPEWTVGVTNWNPSDITQYVGIFSEAAAKILESKQKIEEAEAIRIR